MKIELMKEHILQGNLDEKFAELYGRDQIESQKARYIKALDGYVAEYGNSENIQIYSVSGRSEISGNHTDHNNGKVIAAAINLDVIAIVTP